ncbi:MAG TPA: PspC domain-containing protein [Candidatus Dormibacteraeota bacterium]|nr:PspC domain-containing protein [Candidatus Dormibacteraeota bacterium]
MDDIQQPGRPGPGDDRIPAGPPPPEPAQAPPYAPPPPPYAPPPPPRRLTRSDDGRVIAGVASGIARHLSVDANLVRLAFAVLSFTGGIGFLLYIAGWLALPSESQPEAPGVTLLRRLGQGGWRAYLAVVAGAIAVAALAGDLDPGHPGLVWGLLLLGFGVALLIRDGDRRPAPPAGPAAPAGAAAPGGPAPAWDAGAAPAPVSGWGWGHHPPRRRRGRSPLTRITLAAVLLVAAGAGLLGDFGVVSVSVQSVLALCLTVVGLGLMVGAWWRPSRGLIALGLVLVPVVLAAGISDVPVRGGAGERLWEPQTVSQLRNGYRLGAGSLTVDLTRVPFGESPSAVHADVGMGMLEVLVPADVPLDIHARVGAGEAQLLDKVDNGLDVDTQVHAAGSPRLGRLSLDLHAGLGNVHVRRADTATVQGAL